MFNNESLPDYPPQLKEFVTHNRADEITKGLTYLQDHRILLISGIGGVGKTTLARAIVETRPANVPLPFWFDFSKKMNATLGDVLENLAGYMKAPEIAGFRVEKREAGQDDINRLTDELQRREQLWLVFDGIDTILDDRYFHDLGMDLLFTSLRESTHNAKIIVTSRVLPLLRNGVALIDALDEKRELKGLKLNFAVDYLMKNGLEGLERKKLDELATGVDGHPLALRLLIELVKKFGISDTLNDLSMFQKRKEDTIKKARRLFEKLAGDEKELLERISVFRQPESMTAIEKMFTERTSKDVVENLMDKSLLETDHKGKYWLHPLIRKFSYDDLKNKIEIHKLACSYYLILPLPEKRSKKDDVQSLIEAQYHACMAKEYDQAASIIFDKNLYEDLDRWGEYRTLIELYSGVLPKDIDESLLSDKQTHSNVIGNLGSAYSALGQVEKAIKYYEKALGIAQEIGDRRNEGTWLRNLGLAYTDLGQVENAIEYYEKALGIAQEIRDRRGEGNSLGNLGLAYTDLGQVEKALGIAQEIRDKRGEGNALENLGLAYTDLGQVEKAIEYYEKALSIAQEIRDRRGERNALGNLGSAYYGLGQVEKAIQYYEKALDISQQIGDRRGEGNALGNLGLAYYSVGQVEKAIQYYEKALDISREIGDRRGEGNRLGNLGLACYSVGQVEKAIQYYEKALDISQQIGDRRGEGAALGNLGLAYSDLGQVEKAIEYYENALAISREIEDRRGEGNALGNLGLAYHSLGQVEKAIQYYEKALGIAQEIRDRRGEGNALGNLGSAYYSLGQVEKAIQYYEKALDISREIGDIRGEGNALGNLGLAYYSVGQVEKAIQYYEKALDISREIGDKREEGADLENLGLAYYSVGQVEKAIQYYEKALAIAQEIGDRRGEGNHLNNLGFAFQMEKKYREALACYLLAKEILIEPNIRTTESNINNLKEELGENEFETLIKEIEPRAEEIIRKIVEGV